MQKACQITGGLFRLNLLCHPEPFDGVYAEQSEVLRYTQDRLSIKLPDLIQGEYPVQFALNVNLDSSLCSE